MSKPFYATLNTSKGGGFAGNLGWDLWLEPPGTGGSTRLWPRGQSHTEIVVIIGGLNIRSGGTSAAGYVVGGGSAPSLWLRRSRGWLAPHLLQAGGAAGWCPT